MAKEAAAKAAKESKKPAKDAVAAKPDKPAKTAKSEKPPKAEKAPATDKQPRVQTEFNVSPELQSIIGIERCSRFQATGKLWDYIKAHNLKDATNGRQINADETLKKAFGKDSFTMFEVGKLLSPHLTKLAA